MATRWKTASGDILKLSSMSEAHLENSILYLNRCNPRQHKMVPLMCKELRLRRQATQCCNPRCAARVDGNYCRSCGTKQKGKGLLHWLIS